MTKTKTEDGVKNDITLRELLELEMAARLICTKYEKEIRINNFKDIELEKEFKHYNSIYEKIFETIKVKVDKYEKDS